MKAEEAKVGMRVYSTDNGVEGTIIDEPFSEYGCYVDFDNGEEHLYIGFGDIDIL